MGAIEPQHRDLILREAETGKTLKEIAAIIGCDVHTLWAERRRHPDFDGALERALVSGAYTWLDEMRQEFRNLSFVGDGHDITRAKLSDARLNIAKFYLEKRFPKEFSPKQQIDVRAVVDLAPAIERANERLRVAQVIDLTPTSVTLPPDTETVDTIDKAETAKLDALTAKMFE